MPVRSKLTGQQSQCSACGLLFTSTSAFDQHRTGRYATNERRCRTQEELRARGCKPNDCGFWRLPMTDAQIANKTSSINIITENSNATTEST